MTAGSMSSPAKRLPWFKWYPADWRADPKLRMCSLAARGLWIELLGFMHEADPYGHLTIGGRSPSAEQIAALVGAPLKVVRKLLAELELRGVYSTTCDGFIVSRRMLRDHQKAGRDRLNGSAGGNPNLKGSCGVPGDGPPQDLNPNHNGGDNGGVNPQDKPGDKAARAHTPATQIPETRYSEDTDVSSAAGAASDPQKSVFDLGKRLLGSGGQVRKLLDHCGGDCGRALDMLRRAEGKSDPKEYVGAILRGDAGARADDVLAATDRLYRELGVLQ